MITSDQARRALTADPWRVAPRLLGAHLISTIGGVEVAIRLTEVEAYGGEGEDPGSHAYRGPTAARHTMFGPAGHAYVYFTYGMHFCVNVVAHRDDRAGGILLRAGRIIDGVEVSFDRRPHARSADVLAQGPARLATCLGVDGTLDGTDLLDPQAPLRLQLRQRAVARSAVDVGPRVGVAGEGAGTAWRFWLREDPTVSRYRPAAVRRR